MKGGRFRSRDGKWLCTECANEWVIAEPGKDLWNFTTLNIAGKPEPVHVKSLNHLRRLEREHGVVSVAANYESSNWDKPPRGR